MRTLRCFRIRARLNDEGDGPIRKTMWVPAMKKAGVPVPPAVPDSPYLRLDDAVGW